MKLIRAALGLKLSDEEWRDMESVYDVVQTPDAELEQQDGRRRSWGQYRKTRDQR